MAKMSLQKPILGYFGSFSPRNLEERLAPQAKILIFPKFNFPKNAGESTHDNTKSGGI